MTKTYEGVTVFNVSKGRPSPLPKSPISTLHCFLKLVTTFPVTALMPSPIIMYKECNRGARVRKIPDLRLE